MRVLLRHGALLLVVCLNQPLVAQKKAAPPADWTNVESTLGRKGTPQPNDVMRFSFPRRDLRVTVGDVPIRPALALGSWVAFKRVGRGNATAMGDLVLLDAEVNDVISALQQGGVQQTALHNHILSGTPHTMYLHILAHGDEAMIAATIRTALEKSKTPLDTFAAPPPALDLDTAAIAGVLGYSGRASGGVYQVSVPRAETIREQSMEVPASMGVATAINFQSTGDGRAAITGDFVMKGPEVNKVIRVLRQNGIGITALHSHLIDETPRLYFMHFWANDDAMKLARGLRAALDQTNSRRATP
ncbi:MAG TPA: DUF1259 domain-containing protein [Gemmatimonadaceae bacterium]|nr:DUF1259 domain-containing protein [Gemmatimonadaceae bacterium]